MLELRTARRPFGIVKHDVERIVGEATLALDAHIGSDSFGLAEQHHRVIDHVRPDVEKNSGAGSSFFATHSA